MIIAIATQKGGTAKTTSAINIASALANRGKRTLLIDLDPQTHASIGLGVKTEGLQSTLYNVLSDRADQKEFIENIIHHYGENLDIAPGHVLLSTIEQEFVDKDQAIGKLKAALNHMVFPYQYIVIDCPPSLGFLTFNALYAADLVVVPIELGTFALYGVAKLLSMIELIRVKMSYSPKIFALATMVDLRTRFSKKMMSKIKEAFQENMFKTAIRTSIAFKESQHAGVPVIDYKPESRASGDYLDLASEILKHFNDHEEEEDKHPGSLILEDDFRDKKTTAPNPHVKDFRIQAPSAAHVFLVGDFNHWRIDENSRLWNQGKGVWQKRMVLQPGRYRYKYVIDGKWVPDPANQIVEPNPYGGIDSILEIQ